MKMTKKEIKKIVRNNFESVQADSEGFPVVTENEIFVHGWVSLDFAMALVATLEKEKISKASI